jgi:3-oxoacyl-[acyl-carrier-protein] synthase II
MSESAEAVVVTGYGVRSAFGPGRAALARNVFQGVPGFRPVSRFGTARYRTGLAACAPDDPGQRGALLECGRAALESAGLTGPLDAAALFGLTGDFTRVTAFWRSREDADGAPDADRVGESLPSRQVEAVAAALDLRGEQTAFTNGCIASTNAIVHGCRLIRSGRADIAVCGGAYLVEEEFFAMFNAGRAFSRDGAMHPFSAGRSGLLLGDGAAVLVLESARHLARRGGRALARIAGWGMAGDAYHVCKPHPEGLGMAAAAHQAIRRAGIDASAVDYVNAHGTSTPLNDSAETAAVKQVFGKDTAVAVSSTKGSTGHALEASGALEAVIAVVALEDQVVPPTAGYLGADPECDLDYVVEGPRSQPLQYVLSMHASFGGANAALVLERV